MGVAKFIPSPIPSVKREFVMCQGNWVAPESWSELFSSPDQDMDHSSGYSCSSPFVFGGRRYEENSVWVVSVVAGDGNGQDAAVTVPMVMADLTVCCVWH